ncbi:hypothetical protein AB0J82_21975 [Asanoa sp. NPDC049518]|uniref:hypothetical protein n=1 Tax=unclassified Asanoa TaxID=2685164 RepID=UPI003421B9FB
MTRWGHDRRTEWVLVRRTTDGQRGLVAIIHGSRPYGLRADGLDLHTGRPVKPTDALPPGTALMLRKSGRGTR